MVLIVPSLVVLARKNQVTAAYSRGTGTVCGVPTAQPSPDFYEVLGVARTATSEDIRQAFKAISMRTHPDAGGNSGLFRLVTEAKNVLSDPVRRAEYDRSLAAAEKVVDDLARREAEVVLREAALRLAQSAYVQPVAPAAGVGSGVAAPGPVSVPGPVVPAVRRYSWEWFLLYWRGWIASTLVLSFGPVVWVLFRAFDVWGALGVAPRYGVVDDVLVWFSSPALRWGWVLVLAAVTGFGAFRFRVYLLVRGWSKALRRSVGSAWLFAGAALPVLPSVWGFVLLVVAAAVPLGVSTLWGRLRSSGGR
jgi:hypothetical protein